MRKIVIESATWTLSRLAPVFPKMCGGLAAMLLTLALSLALAPPLAAQEAEPQNGLWRPPQGFEQLRGVILPADEWTDGNRVTSVFESVVEQARVATVRIVLDRKQVALGTVVSSDGLIVTKASELTGDNLGVVMHDGTAFVRVKLLSQDEASDLALLRVSADNLSPAPWASPSDVPRWGQWVAAPWAVARRVQTGVISAVTRRVPREGGAMGIRGGGEGPAFGGVAIAVVVPDSGAAEAGIEPDDVITHVEGTATDTWDKLREAVAQFPPGQTIIVTVRRGHETSDFAVTLREHKKLFGREGGPPLVGDTSDRRNGFDLILQHHIPLAPNQCGGPLVNLDGKVVGLNIARATRNEAYALPADLVLKTLERLKQDAGLTPVTTPQTR